MTTRVLISFFCDDRPGVTEQLSAVIDACDGNWMDSRLSRLGGQFAGVMQVLLPEHQEDALREHLSALAEKGITAIISHAGERTAGDPDLRRLRLMGPDRPGIVRELTHALASAGFNLQTLDTTVESAPMSGELLFRAEAIIELSRESHLDELEWKLDAMAEDMTLEIDVHALPDSDAHFHSHSA